MKLSALIYHERVNALNARKSPIVDVELSAYLAEKFELIRQYEFASFDLWRRLCYCVNTHKL